MSKPVDDKLITDFRTAHGAIFKTLAGKSSEELRRLLRPHDEAGFRGNQDSDALVTLRQKLDEALDALTLFEIGLELGCYTYEQIQDALPPGLKELITGEKSDVLLRYANAYLYFGVRMLAGRYAPLPWFSSESPSECKKALQDDKITLPNERTGEKTNLRFFSLETPPQPFSEGGVKSPPVAASADTSKAFAKFLDEQHDPGWTTALDFLDDLQRKVEGKEAGERKVEATTTPSVSSGVSGPTAAAANEFKLRQYDSGESAQYELWLRGLVPLGPSNHDARGVLSGDKNTTRRKAPSHSTEQNDRFEEITKGLIQWVDTRVAFYLRYTRGQMKHLPESEADYQSIQPEDKVITNPVASRFALADMYWIARLLRAEVSTNGSVNYSKLSWVELLRFHATFVDDKALVRRLRFNQDVLRSVFDFVCDLVQNAVELSDHGEQSCFDEKDHPAQSDLPPCNRKWRAVFDEELQEIDKQRGRRSYTVQSAPAANTVSVCTANPHEGWSERLITGKEPQGRVGLAFSGGGVRSATFNLGVLQGLQGHDLLRQVDYLSTVSGGGYVGAWLVGNVRRTRHWLGRSTCWDESVAHLRSYASYLAPITGILSADTWTLAASWIRNTVLVQLSGLSALLALLMAVLGTRMFFLYLADEADAHYKAVGGLVLVMALVVTGTLICNFWANRVETGKGALSGSKVRWLTVLPSWLGSFGIAAMLLAVARKDTWTGCPCDGLHNYSKILLRAWDWMWGIVLFYWIAMLLIAWLVAKLSVPDAYKADLDAATADTSKAEELYRAGAQSKASNANALRARWTWCRIKQMAIAAHPIRRRLWQSLWIGTLCVIVLYLALCAVLYLYLAFPDWWHVAAKANQAHLDSYVFVLGPALVLTAFTLSVVLFIGLTGRNSNEAQREWWTRYGAWLTIYAVVGLALSAAAVFGPRLAAWTIHLRFQTSGGTTRIGWGPILSWIGTVVGGLFAGNSSKTAGDGSAGKKPGLEILARLGGFLFVVGFLIASASLLYLFLFNFTTSDLPGTYYWEALNDFDCFRFIAVFVVLVGITLLFSYFFDINIFGLSQFYRNRLVRSFLGATRWAPGVREQHPFTKFDFKDDLWLSDLKKDFRGPFPIFNCTLNLAGSADLKVRTRHSASFSLTPLRCGADRPMVGYAPTGAPDPEESGPNFAAGVRLGQAMAISGAAVSPNMGYNTSPLVALLLTMFNVRLGWWFPNPGQSRWNGKGLRFSLYYLSKELLGIAGENRKFLNVTDGGHFENLGVYELIRRRCKVIIACDAECDEVLQFGALGNLVRICATDFGAVIEIDVKAIREQKEGHSLAHATVGKIKYSNGSIGYLIYLKASVTGDEDIGIAQYRSVHPSFPHETTANQFFTEAQFESYRKLGLHIVRNALRGSQCGDDPLSVAEKLADVSAPMGFAGDAFLRHTSSLQHKWKEFREASCLHKFVEEIMSPTPPRRAAFTLSSEELCMALELIQLMEDVFIDLRLDDFWEHPDNRGWAIMFMRWARSPRFQAAWNRTHRTFGIRFEYFCEARLGLKRDTPIVRV